jgi:hypothetical protein
LKELRGLRIGRRKREMKENAGEEDYKTKVIFMIMIFWNVTSCRMVDKCQNLG